MSKKIEKTQDQNIEIMGTVIKIRYYKNTWGIIEVEVDQVIQGEPLTDKWGNIICKGEMPQVTEGSSYVINASYVQDPKYGDQYNINRLYSAFDGSTANDRSKKQFLTSLYPPSIIDSLYNTFEDPFVVLEKGDAHELVKVKGIGFVKAVSYINKFQANLGLGKIYTELPEYNLTHRMVERLMSRYHSPDLVIQRVKEDPYVMIDEVSGIGWATADKIALAGGIGQYDPRRIGAYLISYLGYCGENGRSWITTDELLGAILDALGEEVPDSAITEAIHRYQDQLWWNADKTQIGLLSYYNIEKKIAEELIRIRNAESFIPSDSWKNWSDIITTVEEQNGWKYTEEQITGIHTALQENITLITGMAGSGKSSLVSGILAVLNKYSYVQCALSGRAASRLSEITGKTGFTIHRLLGYPCYDAGSKNGFVYHDENPLFYEIYILDEISMVNSLLFYSLLRAIPSGAKLVCLGDHGQLEAIGSGNIAHDMMLSPEIPTIILTKIHRQAEASGIISEAYKVRQGVQIIEKEWAGDSIRGELQDLHIKAYSDMSNTFYEIMKQYSKLYESKQFDLSQLQVIVPVKSKGSASTYLLNNAIQELVNPTDRKKREVVVYSAGKPTMLREGDKIINTKNNYRTDPTIYNGNMGIIRKIDKVDGNIIVDFFGIGRVEVSSEDWGSLDLGYAITVHKSQGSEWDHVIVGIDYSGYSLLTRELVYTAITRAKKHCDLITQNSALRYAVINEAVSQKQTHLLYLLHDITHPVLVF